MAVVLGCGSAAAADKFEIQVYEADINEPGQPGLELHTNYTMSGHADPDYEGEVPARHALRMTLEPAIGVTEWLELGAYLQGMADAEGTIRYGGVKLRAKMVVPKRLDLPLFLGLNVEIGRVPKTVEEQGWANELRPIVGWTNGWILLDLNPIIGYALSGPDRFQLEFEPAAKASINTQQGFAVGLEHYAGLGLLRDGFLPVHKQDHLLFLTFDLAKPAGAPEDPSAWELNAGLGHALTQETPQQWIFKTILGRPW